MISYKRNMNSHSTKGKAMTHQVLIVKEEKYYVATDIVSGIASQGLSVEESLANLKEAIELYYEDDIPSTDNNQPAFLTTLEVLA